VLEGLAQPALTCLRDTEFVNATNLDCNTDLKLICNLNRETSSGIEYRFIGVPFPSSSNTVRGNSSL
jgi:hypothetical protein